MNNIYLLKKKKYRPDSNVAARSWFLESNLAAFFSAALLYTCTLFFAGVEYMAVVVLVSIPFWRLIRPAPELLMFSTIVCLSHIAAVVFDNKDPSLAVFTVFYVVAMPYIASLLTERLRCWLIWFTTIEACVAIFEMYTGSQYIFAAQATSFDLQSGSSTLLYDMRAFGLSSNSSFASEKIMLALMLLPTVNISSVRWVRVMPLLILLAGMLATYNKSAIIGLIVYWIILPQSNRSRVMVILSRILMICIVVILGYYFSGNFLDEQLTRGSGNFDIFFLLSGRELIWNDVINYISINPFFGNVGTVYLVEYFGRNQHAHNSFLALISSYGLLPGVFYIFYVARNINSGNVAFVLGLLFFSMTQYGVFWKLSYTDIIFHWALIYSYGFFKKFGND